MEGIIKIYWGTEASVRLKEYDDTRLIRQRKTLSVAPDFANIQDEEKDGLEEEEDEQGEKCWENAASLEVCQRMGDFIERLNMKKALSLLKSAQETFPEEDVFEVDRGSTPDSSESPPVSE